VGYKVAFVPFSAEHPTEWGRTSSPASSKGEARGRPVGVRAGALLIADDVGNTVWRVT